MLRLGLKALGLVAPGEVERRAVDQFLTPMRRRAKPAENPGRALPEPRSFAVSFEGVTLAARAYGEGTAVLCVHGWSGAGEDFSALVEPLVRVGHRVVTFDHPAHGESEGTRTNVLQMARAARAMAEVTGPLHAVVGHSLGGAAVVRALADGLAASRAVLVAPVAEPKLFVRRAGTMLGLSEPQLERMLAEMVRRVGPWEQVSIAQLAARLSMPALVVHDRSDREVPVAHGEAIASAWHGAGLEVTDGLGHRRILSAPLAVKRIAEFVG